MITAKLTPFKSQTWKDIPLNIYSKLPGRPPNSELTKDQLQQEVATVSRNWLTRMETYMLNTLINVQGIQGDKCGQLNITDETLAFRMKSSLSLIKKSLHSLKKKFPDALKFHYYHPSPFKTRRQIEVDWNFLVATIHDFQPDCPKFSMIPDGVKSNHETTELSSSIYNKCTKKEISNEYNISMANAMLKFPVGNFLGSPSFTRENKFEEEEVLTKESSAGGDMIIPQAESKNSSLELFLPDLQTQLIKITNHLREAEIKEEEEIPQIDYTEINNSPPSPNTLPDDVAAFLATKTPEEIEKNSLFRCKDIPGIRFHMWQEGFPMDETSWSYQSLSKQKRINDEKEAEKRRRREEDDKRNPYTKPIERVWTKQALRKKRIEELHIRYLNWKEVCIKEGCNLTEIRRRMIINEQYEPFTQDTSNWDYRVHPLYGFMNETQRDRAFTNAVIYWMPSPTGRFSDRTIKMMKKAREIADSLGANYIDFIGAQYKAIPLDKLYYNNLLSSKWAEIRYQKWIEEDGELPEREGNLRGKTWWALEGRYGRKSLTKRHRKSLMEELEQDRAEIEKWIQEGGYE